MTLRFDHPITLLGGGTVEERTLDLALRRTSALVAADGGANRFAPGDPAVDAIVGDMDSLARRDAWSAALGPRLAHLPEQDTTDLEKCLYAVDAPLYLGVGFFGGRIDHTLAAAHVLLKRAADKVLLLSERDVMFLAPLDWSAEISRGDRVSIVPIVPVRGVASSGLRWPVDGLDLAMGARIGTSNEASETRVSVRFDRLGAAIILPIERLDAAMASVV